MLLADYAVLADGKLTIVGGGWSWVIGSQPLALAIKIEVPWDRANTKHKLRIELVDADGEAVLVPTEAGDQQFSIEGEFEVGRPPGLSPGTPLDSMLAVNLPAQPLAP